MDFDVSSAQKKVAFDRKVDNMLDFFEKTYC